MEGMTAMVSVRVGIVNHQQGWLQATSREFDYNAGHSGSSDLNRESCDVTGALRCFILSQWYVSYIYI